MAATGRVPLWVAVAAMWRTSTVSIEVSDNVTVLGIFCRPVRVSWFRND